MPRKRKPKGPLCGGEKRDGGKCERPAGWGTSHFGVGTCKLHGGSAPFAELNGVVELARREMVVMGCPISIEPKTAILECIRIVAGEVRFASDRVAELELEDAVGPVRTLKLVPAGVGADDDAPAIPAPSVDEMRFGPPMLHIWINVRDRAMDRLVAYSVAAMRAKVEDELVKIAKREAEMLADAVRGMLVDFGVDLNRPDAPAIMRKHMTLLAGGMAA